MASTGGDELMGARFLLIRGRLLVLISCFDRISEQVYDFQQGVVS